MRYIKKDIESTAKYARNSNLELLRIISMLLIIGHHFVVNSGITEYYDFNSITPNMIFLQFWGMWGKTAINVFVLISGYFMCTSVLTVKRFGKIYLEAKFYKLVLFILLFMLDYQTLGLKSIFKLLFGYWYGIGNGFTSSFLAFYLLIPFFNILIKNMNKKLHLLLVALLVFMYTIVGTFFMNNSIFSEPIWYGVLYFVAAYIRLYPAEWMTSKKTINSILFVCIGLAYTSILVVDFIGVRFGFEAYYYMIADSNKFLAFMIGLFTFLLFNNLNIKQSNAINSIATTTFGVLCIHANSDAMRTFLWKDLLKVPEAYFMDTGELFLFALFSMFIVFCVCSVIDMLRIRFVEKPLLQWLDRYEWWRKELY